MAKGSVKFFNETKGYGFITPEDGGGDVFVHITDVREAGYDDLAKGEKVEYDRVENRGRWKATDIRKF